MNEEQILDQLNEIFQNVFDDDDLKITAETSAEDIEDWDSLAHITIITIAEKRFNVQFDMDEIPEMQNVGDLVSAIMRRGN